MGALAWPAVVLECEYDRSPLVHVARRVNNFHLALVAQWRTPLPCRVGTCSGEHPHIFLGGFHQETRLGHRYCAFCVVHPGMDVCPCRVWSGVTQQTLVAPESTRRQAKFSAAAARLRRLTPRWSGRVRDKVTSSFRGARAAQLNR